MTLWLRIITSAVRSWTRFYTWRVAPSLREARRAEIESDLWEHFHADGRAPTLSLEIAGRLILGIPDDVRWRIEHVSTNPVSVWRAIAWSLGTAAVLTCLWVGLTVRPEQPPQPPAVPDFSWRRTRPVPPPPPPPPPPCNPPGIGRARFSPCTPL